MAFVSDAQRRWYFANKGKHNIYSKKKKKVNTSTKRQTTYHTGKNIEKVPKKYIKSAGGDCYDVHGNTILEKNKNWSIVHGTATGQGEIAGLRHGHCWLEEDKEYTQGDGTKYTITIVHDYSNNKHIEMPKQLYYKIGKITNTKKYTSEQFRKKIVKEKHWGPFDNKKHQYKPGTDPIKELIKQDNRKMTATVIKGNKEIKENKQDVKKLKQAQDYKEDSKNKFYNTKTEKYTSKRNNIHKKLLNKVNNEKAIAKKGEKPKVIFVGGLSGSGKTTAIKQLIKRTDNKEDYQAYPDYVYLNADDFKSWLPEYDGYNSTYLHEESSDLFDKAIIKYRNENKQLILDSTLKNTEKAAQKIDAFKRKGYEVILIGTNIKGEIAINRAVSRFKETKRHVPLEYIKDSAKKTNKSVLDLRHKTKKYSIYDTTGVKPGDKPKLVESDKSLKQDRQEDAKTIVTNEKDWRKIGTDKSDLKGYDTKKHKKVKTKI